MRGTAPPSSRKLIETPVDPPSFVESNAPEKNGRRLTAVPLYVPGVRIPGTAMPTFGLVSSNSEQELRSSKFTTYSYQ